MAMRETTASATVVHAMSLPGAIVMQLYEFDCQQNAISNWLTEESHRQQFAFNVLPRTARVAVFIDDATPGKPHGSINSPDLKAIVSFFEKGAKQSFMDLSFLVHISGRTLYTFYTGPIPKPKLV